ncbi:MAG: PilZ domain-containing protein [Nitrospirae bacterium]|nr:PilZ domain-containing protein [Nitrospirota bacterium]
MNADATAEAQGVRQRQDVRVQATMVVRYHVLTARDFEKQRDLLDSRASSLSSYYRWITQQPTITGTKEKDEVASRFLHLLFDLQGRVNRVLQLLERQAEGAASHLTARTVDVSAGGALLQLDQPVRAGARIKIVIDVPYMYGIEIPALCDVRSIDEVTEDERKTWLAGISFSVIGEEDRDLLVRYIFQRQRDTLRRRRMGEEG